MSAAALVSCIMPTRNRRRFVAQSIQYFLRQSYEPRELIIVDDGEDAVGDLAASDERIRYLRVDHRLPLGAKRNLACEASRGDLIAHWDDDDWIGAQRLQIQIDEMARADAEVCGTRELLHYVVAAGEAWLYRAADRQPSELPGCTLVYRRSAWARAPFPEINVGEDGAFLARLGGDGACSVADSSFYLALIHGANTAAKHLKDRRWSRQPFHQVETRLSADRDFYVRLRTGRTAARPLPASSITVAADFNVATGYGSMAEYLVLGMARAGAAVNVAPLSLQPAGLSDEFRGIVRRSRPEAGAPVIYFSWPRPPLDGFRGAADLVINTMWESTRLPSGWSEALNRTRAVIVPTPFVADVFRGGGVAVPIEVIREGIDPAVYHYEDRPGRPELTTLIVAPMDGRKNVQCGIEAWQRAFAGDPTARLIIKTSYNYHNYTPDDSRVTYVDAVEATRGIAHWYRQADVLLALGNEGFGLPLIEGMATGLAVIALDSEGQADVCAQAKGCLLPVPATRRQPFDGLFGRCGDRGVPDVDDVAAHLRWVAGHREQAKQMGREASAWALRHRNVWNKGPAVIDVLERRIQPPRPLRRARTFWVPSWGRPCGIAEYTAHLLEFLPHSRARAQAPEPGSLRTLHLQHEPSLFGDAELTDGIERARAAGIPVVVTEHTVLPHAPEWERRADLLIALTRRGSDMLRRRRPDKRVEYVPHGCPTWFPPRKQQRQRVIGAFGFCELHKGFWQLLEVLRQVPGTELLMFSHAKSTDLEARWNEAAAGLPVRRIATFTPAEEAAHRLASEADLLVFWYDEIAHAAASGAVRIGLATGVPVLTSRTSWFDDLQEATYQPERLVEGVETLLDDSQLRRRLEEGAREYCHRHSWARSAERHLALWSSVETCH